MFFILIVVIGLVTWALYLMQEAIQSREFSLMLAGFLVSTAAAGMMAVYFLMSHYVGYMSEMAHRSYVMEEWAEPVVWSGDSEYWTEVNNPLEFNSIHYRSN
jgi:cytochrome b subunit of formate dehydrogenase